jgi:hypothetical protein
VLRAALQRILGVDVVVVVVVAAAAAILTHPEGSVLLELGDPALGDVEDVAMPTDPGRVGAASSIP